MRPVVLQVYDFSLDGIIGEEDTEFFDFCRGLPEDPEHDAWTVDSIERAGLHIMGRVTYEEMALHFPTAPAADHDQAGTTDAIAAAMNRIPKAVFSRTLQAADWPQTTIISGDTATELDALRRQGGGEILAHGGASFVQSLTRLDLVDEYRLIVAPYVVGGGARLFGDQARPRRLELVSSTAFGNGVVALVYRRPR